MNINARIHSTACSLCTPGHHCGVDCTVEKGKIVRVEGTADHPYSHGTLCTKGAALRNYIYREDRLRSPMKRVGKRGEGRFEPIGWEEAYDTIAKRLLRLREEHGAASVAFYSGYTKWYLPFFHRFVNLFGSPNCATDACACNFATVMANRATAQGGARPDFKNANTFLGWSYEGYWSNHTTVENVRALKARGGKVIIIDPRYTPAARNLADIYLPIRPGTDGALALGMAKLILDKGWADTDYIQRYTYGFAEYKALVDQYPLERVCQLTGLKAEDVLRATEIYATNGPACTYFSSSAIVHHVNGFQTHRAILCLSALTGNYDRPGGNLPGAYSMLHRPTSLKNREKEFQTHALPDVTGSISHGRFPLWDKYTHEFQAMDLLRALESGEPYPIRAVFGMGMNAHMFPQPDKLLAAMADKLDFFVDVDLFMTDTAKFADILLPACSGLERGDLKLYPGDFLFYTQPVIEPLYESRSDVDILCQLAQAMGMEDEFLSRGYEAGMDYIIEGCGVTMAELKAAGKPVKAPAATPITIGGCLEKGFPTPSGKFEFYSQAIAAMDPAYGLDPLPTYLPTPQPAEHPFCLVTGARIPTALHSRLHGAPWLRDLRPEPLCEMHPTDADTLGLQEGEWVELYNNCGSITVQLHRTNSTLPGVIHVYHSYPEASVNRLVDRDHLDPYTGYPGYKDIYCGVRKIREV